MISPDTDLQNELLRSIAASLKGIQSSLDQLSGAVEGVSEAIEKAHEPEGDLGHHLVTALKDISSALHKRAQQERSPQHHQPAPRPYPTQPAHPAQQPRREERPPKHQQEESFSQDRHKLVEESSGELPADIQTGTQTVPTAPPHARKPRPNRRRGGANRGNPPPQSSPQDAAPPASE